MFWKGSTKKKSNISDCKNPWLYQMYPWFSRASDKPTKFSKYFRTRPIGKWNIKNHKNKDKFLFIELNFQKKAAIFWKGSTKKNQIFLIVRIHDYIKCIPDFPALPTNHPSFPNVSELDQLISEILKIIKTMINFYLSSWIFKKRQKFNSRRLL